MRLLILLLEAAVEAGGIRKYFHEMAGSLTEGPC